MMTEVGPMLVAVRSPIFERLESYASSVCTKVVECSEGATREAIEFRDKFLPAVSDINQVVIQQLPSGAGSFSVNDGILKVSEETIARLLGVVLDDIKKRQLVGHNLDEKEIPILIEKIVTVFILHELRHRTQGIPLYRDVQKIKKIAGDLVMTELDAFADRDAAFAYGAIFREDVSRAAFLRAFREALFFSANYFFKAFPISEFKDGKIARVIAVFLMAARLAPLALSGKIEEKQDLPLDAPLHVILSLEKKQMVVFKGEPSKKMLAVANDTNEVGGLIEDIKNGRLDSAMDRSIKLAYHLSL